MSARNRLTRVARLALPSRVKAAGRALLGSEAPRSDRRRPVPNRSPAPSPKAVPEAEAGAALLRVLRTGGSLNAALTAGTRALLDARQAGVAVAVAATLHKDPLTRTAADLVAGMVAATQGFDRLAWTHLSTLPDAVWATLAPGEFVRSGLHVDAEAALSRVQRVVDTAAEDLPAASWLAMLEPTFGYGDQKLTRQLYTVFDARVGDGIGLDPELVIQRNWLRRWVEADPDGRTAAASPEAVVSVAIMAYGHPGRFRATANIGDHVQSVASLGHLARHQGLRYSGPEDLVDLMTQLRERTRPELQRSAVRATVDLLQIDRDASRYSAIPPNTWTLAFGWYMHAIFDMRYDFPFHPNLLPIFVSFHCSNRDLLTEESIGYLRRFAPIGCRDWTTVDILLSVGVPAFFSGCLTTTVRTVFPQSLAGVAADGPVAYVDMPSKLVPKGAPKHRHSDDAVRFRTFAANMFDAIDLLETYRRSYSGLVTSRLHCYLPVRSLGVPVDFQPENRSDPRFAGLIDITDAEFTRIQSTIDVKLEQVLTAILSGRSAAEVYALWADINADDVAAAERRRARDEPLPARRHDLRAGARAVGDTLGVIADSADTIHVAVHVGAKDRPALPVMLQSAASRASRPLHVWLVTRDPKRLDADALHRHCGAAVTVVSTHGLEVPTTPNSAPVTDRDLSLLVLPEILRQIDRLVVVPAQAVVLGDLADLADLDLGGHLFAAARSQHRNASGFGVIHRAASRLQTKTVPAAELRRRAHARHRFDFDAFEIGVLVVDAAAWRNRQILETSVPFIEEFGLTLRELLHLEAGPDRADVPRRWYVVPTREPLDDAALVHWVKDPKPWSGDAAPGTDLWLAAQRAEEAPPVR